ncbi:MULTISPECIES: nucleotidyltransferase domain-containing protein [Thermodesulfovibrio]|jgi:predicted nucleotidyltransferase|uniref:nucleotidyltransferase domain-containing protein n=1 Tax=Thermodesulfovibrio TaxID=28261 RepID=UPI00260A0AFE|nr:nucleotidyltransferase domain-containing protein [Thermodesulfovibrio sp.]
MEKLNNLKKIFKKYNIALAYIFGSQKDNAIKLLQSKLIHIDDPLTDIDIGVVFDFNIEQLKEKRHIYAKLYNEISEIFKPYNLDLIFLQECHFLLQMEAIEGECIYSISEEKRDNYEMEILRKYPDFRYLYNKFLEESLEEY